MSRRPRPGREGDHGFWVRISRNTGTRTAPSDSVHELSLVRGHRRRGYSSRRSAPGGSDPPAHRPAAPGRPGHARLLLDARQRRHRPGGLRAGCRAGPGQTAVSSVQRAVRTRRHDCVRMPRLQEPGRRGGGAARTSTSRLSTWRRCDEWAASTGTTTGHGTTMRWSGDGPPAAHAHDAGDHTQYQTGRERIQLLERVFGENDRMAAENRGDLEREGVIAINLMSAPGAGKTTLLRETLRRAHRSASGRGHRRRHRDQPRRRPAAQPGRDHRADQHRRWLRRRVSPRCAHGSVCPRPPAASQPGSDPH